MMRGNLRGRATGKTELMGSFGENLRREREMRGITLEEISAATKISVRFLGRIRNKLAANAAHQLSLRLRLDGEVSAG